MKIRAYSFALAVLSVVSAAVFAAPGACCSPAEAERTMIAVDCCSTMAECPQLKAAGPAVVQAEGQGFAIGVPAIAPEPPSAVQLSNLDSRFELDDPAYAGPPLYRLHAQLLI